jgi:hypothetical protein
MGMQNFRIKSRMCNMTMKTYISNVNLYPANV